MLKIYADALEVVRMTNGVVAVIERHDPDLARQLKKARSSIPLNIARGVTRRARGGTCTTDTRRDPRNESIAVLGVGAGVPVPHEVPADVIDKLRKIVGTLCNCIGGHR